MTNQNTSVQNNEILTIKLQVNEHEEVLLDTGAAYNLVNPYTIRRIKAPIGKLPDEVFLRTISGNKLQNMFEMCS